MPSILVVNRTRANAEAVASALSETDAQLDMAAASSSEARPFARTFAPDIALLELDVAIGLRLVRDLLRDHPLLRVFVYGSTDDEREVAAWAEAGVARIVVRTVPLQELVRSVREAACVGASADRAKAIVHRAAGPTNLIRGKPGGSVDLTQRERDVLQLIAVGLSNREIADTLSLGLPTVKNHVQHLMRKLGVHRRSDAALYWHENNVTEISC